MAIVEYYEGQRIERLAAPWNARTRVHEYGGGAFVADGRTLYFSHFDDGCIYRQEPGKTPEPITPPSAGIRTGYADLLFDPHGQRLIAVREVHHPESEAESSLVTICLRGDSPMSVIASGHDFFASPTLSPGGSELAWLTWSHPNMPWDGTTLWIASAQSDGTFQQPRQVAGSAEESVFQPGFDGHGHLVFASDRHDWWNLYRVTVDDYRADVFDARPIVTREAEFGKPQWMFGQRTWVNGPDGQLVCASTRDGLWTVSIFNGETLEPLSLPYTQIEQIGLNGNGQLCVLGSHPTCITELYECALEDSTSGRVLSRSSTLPVDVASLSKGQPISFPSARGRIAHAFFYAPLNNAHAGPQGEKPPLIVMSHGGPTSSAHQGLKLAIQFWTTRGFAVVDVNYGGSSGYGRAYRNALKGQWGIVDVEDCVAAAEYVSSQGWVDPRRRAIRGGSAGGYTTLAALAFTDAFQAGASHYGIGDLEALARDTHKFESRYLDGLIGPYPESAELYKIRSPIHSADQISCPVIFFQGMEDKVVPPNQADMMAKALQSNGVPHRHVTYEGEGHGFLKAENIAHALNTELEFYQEIFGLA